MREEKTENRSGSEQLEAGLGGNEKLARRVLLKMDVRYVLVIPMQHHKQVCFSI